MWTLYVCIFFLCIEIPAAQQMSVYQPQMVQPGMMPQGLQVYKCYLYAEKHCIILLGSVVIICPWKMVSLILQNGFQPTSTYQAQPQQMAGGMQQPMYTGKLCNSSVCCENWSLLSLLLSSW